MYEFPKPDAKHLEALAGEVEPEQCGQNPPGYNVDAPCQRPQGHDGRHEFNAGSAGISWPGAA